MRADTFPYDVFLSHSSKDKPVVRPLADRLRKDELKVWFDEWVIKPGDPIQKKIEDGLEESRLLVLCMSANAFGSDWAQLEAGTFRFRDPLNKDRRFIPLRLDDAPIKGSLVQFLHINWRPEDREQEYAKLIEACRRPETWPLPRKNEKPMTTPTASSGLLEEVESDGKMLLDKPAISFAEHQNWQEEAATVVKTVFPNDWSKLAFLLGPPNRRKTTPYHEALKSHDKRNTERAEALKEQLDILQSFIRQIERLARRNGGQGNGDVEPMN